MEITRNYYLQQLINRKNDGMVKVITGIRRCGKSYLLDPLFRNYLLSEHVPADHIIKIEFDRAINKKYHNDAALLEQDILALISNGEPYYLILDEIQLVKDFEFVVSGLLHEPNVDIYITGSNSKFLSSDIITEFRGRGEQIHVQPLSFSEFCTVATGDKAKALHEYLTYGGMPLTLAKKTAQDKAGYLKNLFEQTYVRDITERHNIKRVDVMDTLINILSSSVGSLTNPQNIYDTFKSKGEKEVSLNTIVSYLAYIEDAFIVKKAMRYDIKGRKYINTPQKYYFADLGLRNARLNFRQQEESHLMENAIYNELVMRGYNVDVGVVGIRKGDKRTQTEVDFVCNLAEHRYYIQSALHMDTREKTVQESRSLNHIPDNFKKMIIVKDCTMPWITEDGIFVVGVIDFLLNRALLEA